MTPETLFLRYLWLIMLLGVGLSTIRLWLQARSQIAKNPDLQVGYNQLYKGFVISMGLPWLVMGIGVVLGDVPGSLNSSNRETAIFLSWLSGLPSFCSSF